MIMMADNLNQLLIDEIRVNRERQNTHRSKIENLLVQINTHLADIAADSNIKEEKSLLSNYTIAGGDNYEIPAVACEHFTKARVFISAVFTAGSSAGITVDLYSRSYRMGEIITIVPYQNQQISNVATSEPIDVENLGIFSFIIINNDISNSVKINQLRVILY